MPGDKISTGGGPGGSWSKPEGDFNLMLPSKRKSFALFKFADNANEWLPIGKGLNLRKLDLEILSVCQFLIGNDGFDRECDLQLV